MIAVQPFADAVGPRIGDLRRRRSQIRVVSPALEHSASLPGHLRQAVDGILQEIADRVFRPIHSASDLDTALKRAVQGLEIFIDLWIATLQVLNPWLQENPDHLTALGHAETDTWTSTESQHLGDEARAWFAAAQDARVAFSDALARHLELPSGSEEVVVQKCIVADFALLYGLFLAGQDHPPGVPDLPVMMGRLAYNAAKDAYVLVATPRFADPSEP